MQPGPPATSAPPRGWTEAPKLPALTGVRILAALAVYASHVGPPAGAPTAMAALFTSGYSGVTVFFVLSGFVLAVNYFDDLRRPNAGAAYRYAVARFARIYPLYLLVLFFVVVRQHALGEGSGDWWTHALAIQPWSPSVEHAYSFNPPAWSVGVEFFLYACFPLLVPLIARLDRPRALLIAAAGVAAAMAALAGAFVISGLGSLPTTDPSSAHRWLYRMPLTRLGDFALGILAARLYFQTRRRGGGGARLGQGLALGAMLVAVGLMCWPGLHYTPWSWDLAYAIPAVVFIFGLAIAPLSWPARLLSLPFVVLLGEASYAFYLVHSPAIGFFGAGQWAAAASLSTVVYEGLILGAILALAVGLHVTVERPARSFLKRILNPRRSPGASPPPAATGTGHVG